MEMKPSSQRLAEALQRSRRHWQAERRMEASAATPAPSARQAFTIALSREAGAQGSSIACTVGERLGWVVYDRELLQHIVDEMGLHEELLTSVDEKWQSWLQECVQTVAEVPTINANTYAALIAPSPVRRRLRHRCRATTHSGTHRPRWPEPHRVKAIQRNSHAWSGMS